MVPGKKMPSAGGRVEYDGITREERIRKNNEALQALSKKKREMFGASQPVGAIGVEGQSEARSSHKTKRKKLTHDPSFGYPNLRSRLSKSGATPLVETQGEGADHGAGNHLETQGEDIGHGFNNNDDYLHDDYLPENDIEEMMIPHKETKLFFDVDERVKDWVMGTAAKKWRDFKADLKAKHFDETKTDRELFAARDPRVHKKDWRWLIKHWRTPLARDRSQRGKDNRAKLSVMHTSGSKSFARLEHELHEENGVVPRTDELFIIAHTHKKGDSTKEVAAKIQEAMAKSY